MQVGNVTCNWLLTSRNLMMLVSFKDLTALLSSEPFSVASLELFSIDSSESLSSTAALAPKTVYATLNKNTATTNLLNDP